MKGTSMGICHAARCSVPLLLLSCSSPPLAMTQETAAPTKIHEAGQARTCTHQAGHLVHQGRQ